MRVENMKGKNGRTIPNQFIITNDRGSVYGNFLKRETFQSYKTTIAVRTQWEDKTETVLDGKFYDYSVTTSKYLAEFLGEPMKTIRAKINAGTYKLESLNPSDHQA